MTGAPSRVSPIYNGEGWIGGQWQAVKSWKTTAGYHIVIADMEHFTVTTDGSSIVRLSETLPCSSPLLAEIVLGPVLLLALALNGIYCLHGSAVTRKDGTAIAFLGSSGAGKSTLGLFLGRHPTSLWKSIADDVIALTLTEGRPFLLPDFPQLKWNHSEQSSLSTWSQLPLVRCYLLDASDVPQPVGVILHSPMNQRSAFQTFVHHTHAARLFDAKLLTYHLGFCDDVTRAVPVRRLQYPRCLASLPLVTEAVRRDLLVDIEAALPAADP
ncbi:MAG: hypothetical protein HOP18_19550 [Deltaproteobacteria bacterium]|nr:hypothetical protein [Deltaproteobacteria bacterium]